MKLMTEEIRNTIPKLRGTEGKKPDEVLVIAKYFTPWTDWTWYAVEFDGEDLFYGFVRGMDNELGYFSLAELESVTGPLGLKVERDLYFGKHTLAEVMARQL